jgi:hypothetical protein
MKQQWTKLVVAGIPGFLFFATGDSENLVFVPLSCLDIKTGNLDEDGFLLGLWPWANCFSNQASFYSHLWPDFRRPAPPNSRGLDDFLGRLVMRIRGTMPFSHDGEPEPGGEEGGEKAADAIQ